MKKHRKRKLISAMDICRLLDMSQHTIHTRLMRGDYGKPIEVGVGSKKKHWRVAIATFEVWHQREFGKLSEFSC